MSERSGRIDSLQRELDAAREAKNETEQRLGDKLNELETMKAEYDEVKRSCKVKPWR